MLAPTGTFCGQCGGCDAQHHGLVSWGTITLPRSSSRSTHVLAKAGVYGLVQVDKPTVGDGAILQKGAWSCTGGG